MTMTKVAIVKMMSRMMKRMMTNLTNPPLGLVSSPVISWLRCGRPQAWIDVVAILGMVVPVVLHTSPGLCVRPARNKLAE